MNLWAIAEWGGFPSPMGLEFWNKQVLLSKAMTEEDGLLGPDFGVVFSLDNYYRSLALACYADAGLEPPALPPALGRSAIARPRGKADLGMALFPGG